MLVGDLERFLSKIDFDGPIPPDPSRPLDTPCWLWMAGLFPAGYGSFWLIGKSVVAHRASYEHFIGPLPPRKSLLWLDHACRVRRCVNPDHLDLVSPGENMIRAQRPRCRKGHLYPKENTITVNNKHGKPTQRLCRICAHARQKRHRDRKRVAQ